MPKPLSAKEAFKLYKQGVEIEVSCPWWPKDHWENKRGRPGKDLTEEHFFDECTYRVKQPTHLK